MLRQHRVGNTYVVSRRMRVVTNLVIGFFLFGQMQIVVAQTSINPTTGNGWTTTATTTGSTTEITNTRRIGANAYNSFDDFGVAAGNTVNLRLEGADNLVNLVRSTRTDINGVLNSYRDTGTTIGGNVFFVNPNGITVGATGVINVGSLSMVVPTQNAMNDYISALQNVNATADDRHLFIGSLKLADNGDIDIKGSINANSGVLLLANTVNISGNITSNGVITANAASGVEMFRTLVNVPQNFQDDLGIFDVNGEIVIGAAESSEGLIDGFNPVKSTSALINVTAGANIQAVGTVQLSAAAKQNPVSVDNGLVEWNTTSAKVDVVGGTIKSSAAAVVIDAQTDVDLKIGGLNGLPLSAAVARSDANAQVNVAGASVIEAATGVSLSASAKTKISATANAESETATLTLAVANIDNTSSAVVADSATISTPGAVSIDSVSDTDVKVMADGLLSDGSGGGLAIAVTDVDSKSTAVISAGAQILNSSSLSVTSSVANSIDTAARSVVSGDPQSLSDAVNNEDKLNDNPSGDPAALKTNINTALNDSADLEDSGQTSSPQLAAAFAYTGVNSSSIATISSGNVAGAVVSSSGDINVIAKSMTDASNLAQGTTATGSGASITAGVSILLAKEVISATVKPDAGQLNLSANNLNVAALNEDYSASTNTVGEMLSIAYAGAGGGGDMGLAGALAINIQDRDSIASVSGNGSLVININGDLDIAASSSVSDAVVASALLSQAEAQDADDKFAANSAAQQDAVAPVTNPDEAGSLGVGAAIAINIIDNNTKANIGGGVSIASTANNASVDANSDSAVITKAEAGSGGGISIVPVLALSTTKDTTTAAINAGGSAIDVQDSVLVNAKHSGSVATYAKGSPGEQGGGGTASVGASIGLGIANETTSASISRNVIAGIDAVDTVTVSSSSNSRFATGAIAGSGGSSDDGDGTTVDSQLADVVAYRNSQSSDTASAESAETSDGKVGVAAAIAYQGTTTRSESQIADGVSITAGGKLTVTSQKQTSAGAKANGAATGANAGIGAAVAITTTSNSNIARIGNDAGTGSATMAVAGVEVKAYSDDAYVDSAVTASQQALSQFSSAAVAGASSQGVGVAGALALNILSDTTTASIEGNTLVSISAAPVDIGAESQSNTDVSAAGTVGVLALVIEEPDAPSVSAGGTPPAADPAGASSSVGVGAGVAVNAANNNTVARIGSGVSFVSAANVALDASSKADASVTATAGVAGDATATVGVGGAVAVSVITDNTRAEIESRSEVLTSSATVSISASHTGVINVSSDGSAAGANAAIGASIAISVSDVILQVLLSRDVNAVGVDLAASSNTSNTTVAKATASGAEQEDPPATAPAAGEKTGVDKKSANLTTFAGDKKAGGSAGDPQSESAETPGGAVTVAAGLAVTVTKSTVTAKNTGTITSSGNTSIASESATDSKANADGSAVDGSNSVGIGAAVAVNTLTQRNSATANNIMSSGGLNVMATQIAGEENDTGAVATSGAGASNVGVAGSVAVNVVDNKSLATFASGTVSGGSVMVKASNDATSTTKAGAIVEGSGSSVGVGAGVAIDVVVNEIVAAIATTAVVSGSSSVAVDANSTFTADLKSEAGKQGDSSGAVGLTGTVAVGVYDNTTRGIIESTNTVVSSGQIHVGASHTNNIAVETGADAAGSNAAIGASIAISVSDANTEALLVSNATANSVELVASSNTSNTTLAKASAAGAEQEDPPATTPAAGEKTGVDKKSGDLTTFASDKKAGGSADDPTSESAETPGGAVSVAAGLAVTVTKATVRAENTGTITTTGNTSIKSESVADAKATADGSAVDGSNSVGIGAAVAVNTLTQLNTATARNISSGGGLTVGATQIAGEENDTGAVATSGAGASNVGVAGSVAVNVINNKSTATFVNGTVTGGVVDIDASNTLNSVSKAGAIVEGSGSSVGVGAGVAIDVVVNEIVAAIATTAVVSGSSSVAVDANSTFTADLKSEAGKQGDSSGAVGLTGTVAVGVYDNTTRGIIESTNTVVSSGQIHVGASHTNNIAVETGADAAGSNAAIGASIAISVSDANTEALLVSNATANSVELVASSNTSNTTLAKASAAGAEQEDPPATAPAAGEKTGVDKKSGDLTTFASDKKAGGSADDPTSESAETPGGAVSVAAGLAVTVTKATVRAENTGTITTTGNTSITSESVADAKATADGSAVDGSNSVGIGAAVAVNTLTQRNTATARNITSGGGLTIGATQIAGEENDIGAVATSGAGASNVGVAGSVAVNVVNNKSLATFDSGVVSGGVVNINASNKTRSVSKAGSSVVGSGSSVGVGAGIAVDVVVNEILAVITTAADVTGSTSVAVDANSSFTADLKGEAGQQGDAPPSGGAVGVSGAVAVGVYSNKTKAEIAAGSVLTSAGEVHVAAIHTNNINVETGADAAGDKAAIGASIAISVSKVETDALVSRNVTADSLMIAASSSTSNATKAKASASGAAPKDDTATGGTTGGASGSGDSSVNKDVDGWQTFATDKDSSGSTASAETEKADASSSEGQVSVAAAVAVTVTDVDTVARIDNGVTVNTTNTASVKSSANTDAQATADGSAANGGVGVGVGVAINVANNYNAAYIAQGATVQAGDIAVSADMSEDVIAGQADPDTVNTFSAQATSGAGAAKVGVAGSLALNTVTNESTAYIAGNENAGIAAKVYSTGDISVKANNNARHVAKAQASVSGTGGGSATSVGIGASVAINTFTNKANAVIRDGVTIGGASNNAVTRAGSLTMASSSEYDSETSAQAGAEGEEGANPSNDIAVDAAVALSIANNDTNTTLGNGNTSAGFSGNIDLKADSKQSNTTQGDGDSAGSKVAIGAVAAVNIATSNTTIGVNSDLKTSAGQITMAASSTSADKALAKASARGASKKKAQDKYGATEEEVDSGDYGNGAGDKKATSSTVLADNSSSMEQSDTGDAEADNKSGDKGKWNVSIAAAVGANVVDNNTTVIVASDKTLAAGGAIAVTANSDSNYMTLGSGEAVADSGSGKGIGIGVGVAVTVTNNDTLAQVASIDNAADVNVKADSTQNMNADFLRELTSEAIAGASADKVAVAGAVATVVTDNNTRAEIVDGSILGDVGALNVASNDQSKISSRAIAWVDPAKKTTAGVGASAAILVSKNSNIARIGDGVSINSADSINVSATNQRVTPATVGLNFADIINVDDALNSALLAGRTRASGSDSDNTGTEPAVDPETGGPSLIFDKLESTATDAKHALEDYVRSRNYYTEAAAGSASTSGSAKYGVAGSFAVTVLQNQTEASIGNVNIKNVAGKVDVIAKTDADIAGFTGSVVKAGNVGVGVSATTLVNVDSTRAFLGNDSAGAVGSVILGVFNSAFKVGDVKVSAASDQKILGIGVSAAAASASGSSGVAVSGVLNTTVLVNKAEAKIANDAQVYSRGSVEVAAAGLTDIASVVGGIALAGKVGVGASIGTSVISGQTHATIGDRAIITAADSVTVSANADENIISIVVGAGASNKVGVAGSVATSVIAASTTATIGSDAEITQSDARDADGLVNGITVQAVDNTSLFSLAGGGAIGGKAGVGAAADVAVFSKNTVAKTSAGSKLIAGGNVAVTAKSKDDIVSLTGAGAVASSGAAVAGVASVKVVVDVTRALMDSFSVIAAGNVDLLAQSDTDLNIYDGTIAISGGSAGVGGAVAVNTIVKDTAAKVAAGTSIIARGDVADSMVYNGELDRSGYVSIGSIARPDSDSEPAIGVNSGELTDAQKQTAAHRGLSVTAFTTEDIETTGISASASQNVAVAGNLSVDVITNTTEAVIGSGATVNAVGIDAADNSASVLVQAYDYTDLNAMLGSGALGVSSAGVGAAGDVSTISKTTLAHVDANANITAEQDVAIRAGSEEDIDSVAAAVGVGSSAGVSGAASVLVINSTTRAYTESNTDLNVGSNTININAGRDFVLEALDRTDVFVFNTALAAGSTAGVGGSAGVVVMTNRTQATVGRGTVSDAQRRTVIRADSDEKLTAIAMGAAGGGTAGVSGQLGVHVLASDTAAIVEDDVTMNRASWNDAASEDEQSLAVLANNKVDMLSIAGTIALGGTAGVGGALTADVVKNKVRATVGKSEIYAGSAGNGNVDLGGGLMVEDGVSIRAGSQKDITAVSVAGSGGGTAGVAGAASILIVGSDYDENDKTSESFSGDMDKFTGTGEGSSNSSQLGVADNGSSRTGGTLGAQGDVEVSSGVSVTQFVDDKSQASGSSYFALDSAGGATGDTIAVVASGAKIKTKGDMEISANDDTTLNVVGGSIAVGGTAGVGGAGALVLLNQGTRAIVNDDDIAAVELDAARTMNVNARANSQIFDVTATVAAGGTAGVSGSLLLNVVDSRAEASIGNGALVNQDAAITADSNQSVIVDANNSNTIIATTANGSGSGTAAVGGVALVNVLNSRTSASIGQAARVDALRDVKVIADASEQVIANGASAAISGVAGVGGVINVTTINTNTAANIESGAIVDSDGNVLLAAEDDTSLVANSWGVAIGVGGAGVGGSFGVNTISKNTRAVIAEGATVNARGNHASSIAVYTGKLVNSGAGDTLLNNIINEIEDESGNETQDGKWQRIVGLSGADRTDGTTPAASTSLGNSDKVSEQIKGLAVVASSTEDVLSSNASAAGGFYAGVSGSGQVLSVTTDTNATVQKGVVLHAADVRLSAADHTKSFSLSGGLAISGVAGVGGAVANGNFIKSTNATLGSDALAGNGVDVTATVDVIVDAESSEDIDEILVNVAGAGIAGVGGGIGVHVVVSDTTAEVGNNAVLDVASNLRVRANSNTEIDAFNGNLSIGGIAGVGAAVGTNVVSNTTTASIGDNARTDANDATEVSADSVSNVTSITIAASGGAVGVAGGIQVNVVNTMAQAFIGLGAQVNTAVGGGNAGQSVSVIASDDSTISSTTAAAAVGAGAAGGTVSVDILRNSASATVGSGAVVNAKNSIDVSAQTAKTLDADSVSAAAGGFGMSGSIAVAAIGGNLNDEAYSQINGEDANGNDNAESGSVNKAGTSSGVNPLASDNDNSQLNDFNSTSTLADDVDQRNADREAQHGVSDDVATSTTPRSGTLAAVGSSAKLKAGGNLNVTAVDTTKTSMLTGAVSAGSVAGAGAASITVVENNTEAQIASNAELNAGATLKVSAVNNKTLDSTAASGAASFANSIAGSIGVTVDSSSARAHVDSGAKLNQDTATRTLASQQNVVVEAVNDAVIHVITGAVSLSIGSGIGGTLNVVTTSQTTQAVIDVGSTGRVSAEGLVNVTAASSATSEAESAVGAGGLFAGIAGGAVTLFDDSSTSASINDGSIIDDADEVKVIALSTRTATADTKGAAIGAIGVGGSVATTELAGVTTATVADNARLGGNAAIGSLTVDATATETATAKAVALAAGIISGAGAVATTRINSRVAAATGRNTRIVADNAVKVRAQATPKALSRTTAGSFGSVTVGASVAVVEVNPNVSATLDGSNISAGSLQVSSKVLISGAGRTADAYAEAASGGLLLGANATVSDTAVTGRAITTLATGTQLNVTANTLISSTQNSDQYAETKSFAAGFAALGGAFSSGDANTVSTVSIADGSDITSGSLTLNASGDDLNQVKARAGTGGAVAGAAARTETNNTSVTNVTVGNANIVSTRLDATASHTARFDHSIDSTSAGAIGASGAVGVHNVDAQVAVSLAGNIQAGVLEARARNNVYKNLVSGYNVTAGAGGLFGGAAADSKTRINRMTATVSVAADTQITSGDNAIEGIIFEAFNQLIADDSAKLDSGGAIAIALADASIIANDVTATVSIGDRANIETGGDFISAAASSLNVQVDAKASTYGAAGAAAGQSTAVVNTSNTVTAGTDSQIFSRGQSKLMAGRRADSQSVSQTVLAYTDLWNKTAFPVETKPEADASLNNNLRVTVASGSLVAAGSDIFLIADKGTTNVKGQGIGKDLYRQALEDTVNFFGSLVGADDVSFDITGGSTSNVASEKVTVDGVVNAGVDNKLKFRIVRNELNNDLEFYEGDYVAGMTPTLIIRETPSGLIGIDSAGNSFNVAIDAEGNYVIAPSDDGLSTSVKLELDFNPLQPILDRLNTVNAELDDIFVKSGGLTAAQVASREAFYRTGQSDAEDSQFAAGLLNNTFTRDSNNKVVVLAGVVQIRNSIVTADTSAANGQAIGAPLTLWEGQKAALEADALEWANGSNNSLGLLVADKNAIILDLQTQANDIQANLIDHGLAINTDLDNIAQWQAEMAADPNIDNSTLIDIANIDINNRRTIINNYNANTLAGRQVTLEGERDSKATSSAAAFASRDAITPNASNIDATLQPYVNRLTQEKNWLQGRVDEYGGADATGNSTLTYQLIDFTDKLYASSADIFVDSAVVDGAGSLVANRDIEISVLNKTPAYMRISGGAEIPFSAGGDVFVNDAPVRTPTLGSLTIGDGAADSAIIKFLNDYAPPGSGGTSLQPPQGPDLIISENLSNFNGLIHLESLFGGVTTDAGVRIDANTIVIRAGKDVVLSYAGGIRHIAGDVKCNFSSSSNCTPSTGAVPGVVAGNNVYIAGEYLNINGKIQSGIPKRTVTINGTAAGQWENGGLVKKLIDPDTNEVYFEVNPLFIAGGYVDLYGHIISTPVDTGNQPAGEIQVMDGYGEIEVVNNTDFDVRVTGMSAGTGVQAKVKITDLDFDLNQQGHDKVTEYTYFRDNAAGQRVDVKTSYLGSTNSQWKTDAEATNLTYQPLTGQQYSWENIRKDGWDETRTVVQETWFFLFKSDKNEISRGPAVKTSRVDNAPIKDDLVVKARPTGVATGGAYAIQERITSTASNGWSEVSGTRRTTDNYVVYKRKQWNESRSGTDFVYVKNFVTADKPIDINFVGNGSGTITLTATGAGDINIAGSILNPSGITSIDSGAGDIVQTNDTAVIWAKDLSLSGRSIGQAIPSTVTPDIAATTRYIPIRTKLAGGGRLLAADVTAGDLILEEIDGDILLGALTAANGEVWLKASGSILNDETAFPLQDNAVTGKRVTLISRSGSVGSNTNAIRVNSDTTADGGVVVTAATDINLSRSTGDFYLISADSSAGDVNIEVADGSLVDNNPVERKDNRTIDQLLGIWDEMEFLTSTTAGNTTSATFDVAQRNVQAQEEIKTREYQTYWRYRNSLADPSAPVTNTRITLSATEASFFADPDAVAAERSAEFARLNEIYGDIGNSFDENYRYTVVTGSDEYRLLTEKAGWSELELLATFGPGLLKEISDTEIRIEDANVSGDNVNITVNNGNVGTYTPDDVLIDLDTVADYSELSDAQKLALLTAERKDVRFDQSSFDETRNTFTRMFISTYDDVDVEVGGKLVVDAAGSDHVYIGSESDLDITRIVSGGDVRIRTAGKLIDSSLAASAAVTGKDIILESGDQSIGSAAQAFSINQLVDGSLTARAGDSIWLQTAQSNPLAIDTVFATNLFTLTTTADVVEYEPDSGVDIRADSVTLDIGGAFGAAGDLINSIDIGLNRSGILLANISDGAWIASPDRDLRVGSFVVGATSRVAGNGNINLQSENGGIVSTGGKLTLLAGGSIVDEIMTVFDADGNIIAENDGARAIEALELDLIANNGDIGAADNYLDIAVTGSQGVWAQADNGSIYIESPDNDLRLRHVSAGNDSRFTAGGDIALINSGDYRSTAGTLAFEAGGSILDESGDSQIEAVDLSLQANNGSLGSASRSLQVATDSISRLSATDGIYLSETRGDMNIGYLYNAAGEVSLHVATPGAWLNVDNGVVDGRMLWTADNMQIDKLTHGGNAEELYFEITSSTGGMADVVNIAYRSEKKVRFGNLETNTGMIIGDVNDLRFDRVLIGEQAVLSNDTTSVFVDNTNSGLHKEYTIQLTSKNKPFHLIFVPESNMIETDAVTLYYDEDWIVNEFGTENSLSRLVEKDLAYLKRPLPTVRKQAEYSDDIEPVEMNDDALNLHSNDDSELFLPLYWSDI